MMPVIYRNVNLEAAEILTNLPGCIELDKSESFTDASCEGVSLQLKDGALEITWNIGHC